MKILLGALGSAAAGLLAVSAAPAAPTAILNAKPLANTTTGSAAASPAPSGPDCDAGAWRTAGITVEGRPENLNPTATYIWHDASGWHLRTSGANDKPHLFSGRVTLRGGSFTGVQEVRNERDDHVRVDGDTIYYRFVTYRAVDGFDFRVGSCSTSERQRLTFAARCDRSLSTAKVDVGAQGRHPASDPFQVVRSL